ncbi:hypothetical protein J437_LFUL009949 [Ladona fulva]|uniref:Aminotransferase class I/classII large domain-containing protein n=1 Tax=Ladona fulva TaxID=123851 RepID=A0A8K0KB13_LADFU|nr:hypothetical protein J437_LFUL009949 [Ladona fulva]
MIYTIRNSFLKSRPTGLMSYVRKSTSGSSAMDYNRFLNPFSAKREPSLIRELTKIYANSPPGTIFLAGGLPNAGTFPFAETNVKLKDGTTFSLSGRSLEAALQYQPTQGYPPLVKKLKEFQIKTHNPPNWDNYEMIITAGSQDGLCKTIEMSLEEEEPIVVQDPIYTGTMAIVKPFRSRLIPIEQDKDGMCPDALRKALQNFFKDQDKRSSKGVPKLMYINPTGANPTGSVLTLERKKEIYKLACEYDLLILEDDPYYFLHFQKENPVSFLSLDTEGRVMRYDSFSKVLSSGIRVGFVTGPKPLVKMLELHMQVSTLHTSSLTQVIIHNLLESWGPEDLHGHFKSIQTFYKSKRDIMLDAAKKYLTGLAEWTVPEAGMFLWIKVNDVVDTYDMVMERGAKKNVLFVPGRAFMTDPSQPCQYIRASYTVPTPEEIDTGMARLADLIREEKDLQK